ncbi:hypothetical protein PTKU46_35380 [Paraburkholderia terrae]
MGPSAWGVTCLLRLTRHKCYDAWVTTMEVEMATYAIDAVRINPMTDRVTHVRWALVNPKTNEWLSPHEIVEVADVVTAIHAGNAVWSFFTLGGLNLLGPKIKTVAHADGNDGIDTEVPDGHVEKFIDDLPRV